MADARGSPVRFHAEPVRRPREHVELQLREGILSGGFPQGERLPSEAELADMFSVSRPTVREALRSLVSAGLIVKTPGAAGGSFVRKLDHESLGSAIQGEMDLLLRLGGVEVDEVTSVRAMLELPAARLAAEHRTDEHVALLREVLERQKALSLDSPGVPRLDTSFHSVLANASGNRVLAAFVSALHRTTQPVHWLQLSPEVAHKTLKQHQAILRAVADRDANAAEKAMRTHLEYVKRYSSGAVAPS
jgi:GntR family transcriptional repressor for pyruvate dehydrogenase complex